MANKVITGARAIVNVNGVAVGIFESISVSNSTGTEPIHILGRYTPAEIAINSQEAVNISCSGFRVVGQGKHVLPKSPKIGDLLNFEPFTITVVDRQSNEIIESITQCVPSTNNTNYNAKATSRISINYIGIISTDESSVGDGEGAGASDLP